MQHSFPYQGLYVVTREGYPSPTALADAVSAAVRGGASAVQYRAQSAVLAEAFLLKEVCQCYAVPLIINDHVALAKKIKANGVHLGAQDTSVKEARSMLGSEVCIGVSCYDSIERAVEAEHTGASYVAFGRFFPSTTKPHASCAHLTTLTEARLHLHIPIVAIGGITAENGGRLLEAGANLLAVIEGVFGTPSPESAARAFQALWTAY